MCEYFAPQYVCSNGNMKRPMVCDAGPTYSIVSSSRVCLGSSTPCIKPGATQLVNGIDLFTDCRNNYICGMLISSID